MRLEVPEHFFLMDHLLDPPQQPPADHECGYNVFQRVGQMVLPQMALAPQRVVYLNLPYWKMEVMEEEGEMSLFLPPQYKSHNKGPPPTPAPSEDRFFMERSSIRTGSHLVRAPPQSISVRERGQEINQTTIQTAQPESEPTQMGVTDNTPHEDLPSTTHLA